MKRNRYALDSAVSGALVKVRHEQNLSNQDLFAKLFEIIPQFIDRELDGRKKLAKEQEAAISAFATASQNLIKFMH